MRTVLLLMALLVAGIVEFIFDVVIDRTSAFVAGGAILVLLVRCWGRCRARSSTVEGTLSA